MARGGLWLPTPPRLLRQEPYLGGGLVQASPCDPFLGGLWTNAWWQTVRLAYAPLCLYVGNEERYTDAAKAIPANPGDLVRIHGDLSGFGLDATQAAAGNRPTATAAGLVYDGATSWMDLTGLASASNSYTLVSVVTPDTVAGTQTILGANAAAESFSHAVAGNVALHDGAASRVGMVSLARKQLLSARVNAATGIVDFYRDGYRLGSAVYDNTFTWGANPVLGAAYGALAGFFDGTQEFFAVIPTALADADLALLQALLTMRYGTPFSPLSIASLDVWFTIALAYMILAGGDVTQFTDRSGLARHALVPAGRNPPAWNVVDSSVDFDSANLEALQVATWGAVQPRTVVGDVRESLTNGTAWDGTAPGNACRLYRTLNWSVYAGANLATLTPSNAWRRMAAVYNGATSQVFADNVSVAGPANAGANAPGGLTLGAFGALTNYSNARFRKHLAVYSCVLNAYEFTALDAYEQLPIS